MTQKRFQERWENTNKSSLPKIYICNLSSNTDLASRIFYFLSSFLFTVTTGKKKKPGEENILSKKELIVRKLSSEPKPTTMKFARERPREFVAYNYKEILLENIKKAGSQYLKKKELRCVSL